MKKIIAFLFLYAFVSLLLWAFISENPNTLPHAFMSTAIMIIAVKGLVWSIKTLDNRDRS